MKRLRSTWPDSFPQLVADLNLDVPALLEASAGTGKTYAIEHLVLRFVAEKPDWKFESLLLLSFTEKTAADLRKRIRERLKTESKNTFWTALERERFFEAHLRCDEASIHTLHGFCHSVLRAHALDNGTLFDSEVADDRALLNDALDGLLRGPWAKDEARLRELLTVLAKGPSDWRKHLVSIALAYQPDRGDVIQPRVSPERLQKSVQELSGCAKNLFDVFNVFDLKLPRGVFQKIRDRMERVTSQDFSDRTKSLADLFIGFRPNNKAVKSGFVTCLTKTAAKNPQWVHLAETCQKFLNASKNWKEENRLRSFTLIAESVEELRERLIWEKKRHGVLSYDDMVLRLVQAIRARPNLVAQLREKYNACIVDEFQDTDPLQWDLLRRLCLGDSEQEKLLPLFLVGDPKQAIYGFRGGDLRTYLDARALLHEMAAKGKAQGTGLKENFRSQHKLIHALNTVFSQPVWFKFSEEENKAGSWKLPDNSDEIVFTSALVPPKPSEGGRALDSNAPVTLRDFSGCTSKGDAQKAVHIWIASEIGLLMAKDFPLKDIAVLTRTNPEAAALERHLRRQGIPCRVQRRGGVFDSVQADQIHLLLTLLESVEDPRVQAQILLLPFLRNTAANWPKGFPETCPEPIRRWAALTHDGKWPEFFQSLFYDTGYLYRVAAETRGGSEVQILRTLARTLTEEGMKTARTLNGLLERFDALRDGEGENTGGEMDENVGDRVTIMTLHMSKGLEFPVVFLAALSDSRKPAFYTLRDEKQFRHVLDKENEQTELEYQQRMTNEDKRLFYVGLTRAKTLLYAPLLPEKFSRSGSGPMGGFAAEALRAASNDHPELFRIDESLLPSTPSAIHIRKDATGVEVSEFPEKDPWEEAGAFFLDRRRRLSSYSQLLRREAATALEEDGRRVNREEGEAEDLPVNAMETVSAQDLPPGANTGNALHELFETLDFALVNQAPDVESLIEDTRIFETAKNILRRQGLAENYAAAAIRLVWNTLHMPLSNLSDNSNSRKSFQLGSVPITERVHEMEFLFPFKELAQSNFSTLPLLEGTRLQNGFLWGFMDLVFRHQGRYYLLDWKSNLLDRYGKGDIEADMRKHHYDLQYQLYSVALDKWLRATLQDSYDPELHFGGVFYIYLRGASPNGFSGFNYKPSLMDLREIYPARLRNILGVKTESEVLV